MGWPNLVALVAVLIFFGFLAWIAYRPEPPQNSQDRDNYWREQAHTFEALFQETFRKMYQAHQENAKMSRRIHKQRLVIKKLKQRADEPESEGQDA